MKMSAHVAPLLLNRKGLLISLKVVTLIYSIFHDVRPPPPPPLTCLNSSPTNSSCSLSFHPGLPVLLDPPQALASGPLHLLCNAFPANVRRACSFPIFSRESNSTFSGGSLATPTKMSTPPAHCSLSPSPL